MVDGKGDCVGCRIVSCVTLVGVGAYLGYHAKRHVGLNRFGLFAMSILVVGLGTAKLLEVYPFAKKKDAAA